MRSLLDMTPVNNVDAEAGMLAVLTKMMMVLPGQRLSEVGVEATGEVYMDSLDDVPTWAVAEAIRKWNRAQSPVLNIKQPHDFRFRPAPAILRQLADIEAARMQHRVLTLDQLLTAEPKIEYSDDHRRHMLGAIRELFHGQKDERST